jgi:hypothetical protein
MCSNNGYKKMWPTNKTAAEDAVGKPDAKQCEHTKSFIVRSKDAVAKDT